MELPTRRKSIAGTDLDGNRVELRFSISQKLYRCPACGGNIDVGEEHVLALILSPERFHQHWHESCATRHIVRTLQSKKVIPV